MKHDIAPVPADFLKSLASGSVAEAWAAFDRFSPRKSTSTFLFLYFLWDIGAVSDCVCLELSVVSELGEMSGLSSGGAFAAFGWKLFIQALALSRLRSGLPTHLGGLAYRSQQRHVLPYAYRCR